jgi:Ca2+-transporting ATPase
LAAAIIYFLLGEPRDGCIMLVFVLGMISIDVVQEWKTDKTLSALKDLSAPQVQVIRDGREQLLPSVNWCRAI